MHHLVYVACCALACAFLHYSNHNGISLLRHLSSHGSGAGSHAAGFYHK